MSAWASSGVSRIAAKTPPRIVLAADNKAFRLVLIHISFKIGALLSPWSFYRMRCLQRPGSLEESQCLRAVAHQYVLGLLVVIEHHFVGLSPDARFFVTTK